jgi:hypothetical protein
VGAFSSGESSDCKSKMILKITIIMGLEYKRDTVGDGGGGDREGGGSKYLTYVWRRHKQIHHIVFQK